MPKPKDSNPVEKRNLINSGKTVKGRINYFKSFKTFLDYKELSVGQVKMTSYLRGSSDKNWT